MFLLNGEILKNQYVMIKMLLHNPYFQQSDHIFLLQVTWSKVCYFSHIHRRYIQDWLVLVFSSMLRLLNISAIDMNCSLRGAILCLIAWFPGPGVYSLGGSRLAWTTLRLLVCLVLMSLTRSRGAAAPKLLDKAQLQVKGRILCCYTRVILPLQPTINL